MQNSENRMRFADYLAYGCGTASGILPSIITGAFLTVYLTDNVGLSAAFVGTTILLLRFTDGVSDLAMGYLIDRTRSRFGKARPWLLLGAIGTALFFFLTFTTPQRLGASSKPIYFVVMYFLLMTVFSTVLGVSGTAILPMLSDTPRERDKLGSCGMAGLIVAGIFATAVSSMMLKAADYTNRGYLIMALVFALAILATGAFPFFRLRESVPMTADAAQKIPLGKSIRALFQNKYFFLATAASLLINLNNAIVSGAGVFFCRDYLGNAGLFTLLSLAMLLPIVIGIAPASVLVKRFGKHATATAGMLLSLLGVVIAALAVLGETPIVWLFFAGHILCGLGRAAYSASFYSLMAEICDYSEWKSGFKMEGMIFSSLSIGNKAGAGFGAAILGWLLAAGSYNGLSATQSAQTILMERNMTILPPILCYALVALCLFLCNLDKINPQIREELTTRRAANMEGIDNV